MKLIRSIQLTVIAFLLILPFNIYSETAETNSIFETPKGQIKITSISYELNMKNSVVVFKGDVNVVGNDMNMTCQTLELYFKTSLKDTSAEDSKYSVEKIVAADSVVIKRPDRGQATAEKAVYYHDSEKIVLTGNPLFQDGDRVEGGGDNTTITLYLKEDRYVVEGTKDDRARLFLNSKDER